MHGTRSTNCAQKGYDDGGTIRMVRNTRNRLWKLMRLTGAERARRRLNIASQIRYKFDLVRNTDTERERDRETRSQLPPPPPRIPPPKTRAQHHSPNTPIV